MKLVEVVIENYRGIRNLHLHLDGLTVLIGENNVGKSAVLEALRMVLARGLNSRRAGQFTEYDFHLADANAMPQAAQAIKLLLHFAEEQRNEWPEEIAQQMNDAIQLDVQGLGHIRLRATGIFNSNLAGFETKLAFVNSDGVERALKNATPLALISKLVPLFFLSALRDASQEFGQRGQFWSGFLKSIQLPDEEREELERTLQEVNNSVIGASSDLAEVTQRISEARRLVPLDSVDPVVLEAIPTRVFDMVGKIQVHLKSTNGAKIPLYRYGEGTQSLAVIMLFQAFVITNLTEAYTPESTPILAMEEPEAHLHPSAIRSVGTLLNNMPGQIIVTSHSGDLVSRVPITSLRRLYKKNGETYIGMVEANTMTSDERRHFDYHVRVTKGALLFARCWLLVEGQSEFWLFPKVAELMNAGIDEKNIAVVEYSQGGGPTPFIKAAKALGIEWFVVADGDHAGTDYINAAKQNLEKGELEGARMIQLQDQDLEHVFWNAGFADIYKNAIPSSCLIGLEGKHQSGSQAFADAVIKNAIGRRKKPGLAMDVALEIERKGINAIPQAIQDTISQIVKLAGG